MAKRLKIYTKTGDSGTTSLFGGERVDKSSARINAYGTVDELNSIIGVIVAFKPDGKIAEKLLRVQSELFALGSGLATPASVKVKIPRVGASNIKRLEREIDIWSLKLPQLKNFILPGGSVVGSHLHMARTVARRAERAIVELANSEKINKLDLIYINRLSDWFFTLARYANQVDGNKEVVWKGRG
ncbi:ATP:cob(I)alamin adenosyltransferase [Candidatus Curtissbacteria bacterium RIFCSPHIGHO2_01_FULL_41_11]|uniref:Corrinoid adenosyltransferase n=1 Tax=Candidatus Curtissbacteria bacterium RIFCSPHIGHO2_01_FULL_41_11 TaxID=1797711 RepID=A0A1F5G741_9BACT|nr:MAG: ATP:cob(I)alamin adenosyltransferase [Candidatus Curtissbacteria bacterium RIFCSPHIGHO2_01_FULL_41_11]